MSKVESVSYVGCPSSGNLTLKYDGKTHEVHHNAVKAKCGEYRDHFTINDIFWAFIPPDLTAEEKETFVGLLNESSIETIRSCKNCAIHKELAGTRIMFLREEDAKRKFANGQINEKDLNSLNFRPDDYSLEMPVTSEKTCLTCGNHSPVRFTGESDIWYYCIATTNSNGKELIIPDDLATTVVCAKWKSLDEVIEEELLAQSTS